MNRKSFSEPLSPNAVTVGASESVAAEAAGSSSQGPRSFDFSQPIELMAELSKNVYYRLRRVALNALKPDPHGVFPINHGQGDASRLPDGKVFTEEQVIEILGPDYQNGVIVDKKCC